MKYENINEVPDFIDGIKVDNKNVVMVYGFHKCGYCGKKQGIILGPLYSLLCEKCTEKKERRFDQTHPLKKCIKCGKEEQMNVDQIKCFSCSLGL